MPSLTHEQQRLAMALANIGAIDWSKLRPLKNPSLPPSPIYLNLRTKSNPKPGPLTEHELGMIGHVLEQVLDHGVSAFGALCPVPKAGDPIADALNQRFSPRLPVIRLHKEGEGDQRRIVDIENDGHVAAGTQVLVIDDLITGADSKLEAIDVLTDAGYPVTDVLVLVDRQQGGRQQLKQRGITLHAAFTLEQLLSFYVRQETLTPGKYGEIMGYIFANQVTSA